MNKLRLSIAICALTASFGGLAAAQQGNTPPQPMDPSQAPMPGMIGQQPHSHEAMMAECANMMREMQAGNPRSGRMTNIMQHCNKMKAARPPAAQPKDATPQQQPPN